jgi:dihydropteroate synthase
MEISCGSQVLLTGKVTYICGIVNVTPDSFSDGGKYLDTKAAILHGLTLMKEGAHIVDIGGYSTAPNHVYVSVEEELSRVIPVIKGLKAHGIDAISVDTMRARVASLAIKSGASWINDQSAAQMDKDMPSVMKDADGIIIMHNGGGQTSGVMAGEEVNYSCILKAVKEFFLNRVKNLSLLGVKKDKIIIDPGIGFGKGLKDSLFIINNMHELSELGAMLLIGLSRKSFLGKMSGIKNPIDRDVISLAASAMSVLSGVNILRTHNVKATREFFLVFDQLR